jgi:hypothetical protein
LTAQDHREERLAGEGEEAQGADDGGETNQIEAEATLGPALAFHLPSI